MKKDAKAVSIELDSMRKNLPVDQEVDLNVFGQSIKVKVFIPLSARVQISNLVSDACFIDGVYEPACFDYAFKYYTLAYLTNVKMPKKQDDAELLVLHSGLFDMVADVIDPDELYELRCACSDKIAAEVRRDQKTFDDLYELVYGFLNEMSQSINALQADQAMAAIVEVAKDPKKLAQVAKEFKRAD